MLKWIDTTGGPAILLPVHYLDKWSWLLDFSGNIPSDFLDPNKTDYGKACGVNDDLEIITLKGFDVFVFGDEPLLTTAVSASSSELFFARLVYVDSLKNIDDLIGSGAFSPTVNWQIRTSFVNNLRHYILFDSAEGGRKVSKENSLDILMEEGQFDIYSAIYDPNPGIRLLLYKFQKN